MHYAKLAGRTIALDSKADRDAVCVHYGAQPVKRDEVRKEARKPIPAYLGYLAKVLMGA